MYTVRMHTISLIELPYDSGRLNLRMGAGPIALLEAGLAETLRKRELDVRVARVRLPGGFYGEGQVLVELQKLAVPLVRETLESGGRPILLSGNCATAALTAVCALGPNETGVVWFDAHGDFNTPETSASGFRDGMALAILTGRCWPKLAERFDSFQALAEKQIIQIGVRHTDEQEEANLENSAIIRIGARHLSQLRSALEQLSVRQLYVHVDVDVLDPSEGQANSYARPGGLRIHEMLDALDLIRNTSPIAAASITAYDPAVDRDGRIGQAIPEIIQRLAI